jgi:hypothetical protein
MSVTRADVQNGVKLKTSQGNRSVGGRVVSDGGSFVVLLDDDGVGSLVNEGTLYDDESVEVHDGEEEETTPGPDPQEQPTVTPSEPTPAEPTPAEPSTTETTGTTDTPSSGEAPVTPTPTQE